MEGRRVSRRTPKLNPLFILFLCMIAALVVLLVVTITLGAKLGKANKNLAAAKTQVTELEKTVQQLESDLEAAQRGATSAEPAAEPAPETNAPPVPSSTTPAIPSNNSSSSSSSSGGLSLDLTGHSEVQVPPTSTLDSYQTSFTTAGVNLRGGPGTNYNRITLVEEGTKVQVAARQNGWSFVKVDGKYGWISSDYLSSSAPSANTSKSSSSSSSTTKKTEATSGSLTRR